jgi:outer membrane protein assembly factor BamA
VTPGIVTRPPVSGTIGTVARLLANAHIGLPATTTFATSKYDDHLRIESIADPYIGAAVGGGGVLGGAVRANFGITFGDMLRNRQLQAIIRVGTSKDDIAAQVAYINRKGRLNWGVIGGFVPARFIGARRAVDVTPSMITQESGNLRYTHEFVGLTTRYNVSRVNRFEFRAGAQRIGYGWQTSTRMIDTASKNVVSSLTEELPGGAPVYVAETQAAFVRDTAVLGPTSPIVGHRLRLDVAPSFGTLTYTDVHLDARRYFMPLRPVTFAVRMEHTGRYGSGANDTRLTPLLIGLQTLVRGYDLSTFMAERCGIGATSCSIVDQLAGNRYAVMNLELRAPLRGLLTGDLNYGSTPIEALMFADGAWLWTAHRQESISADRFRSVGAGARLNLGGFILEITGARPFDKPKNGWTASFLIRPGF